MINEYCPRCCELTNMTISTAEKEEKKENGDRIKLLTNSYQCNKCNTFIRSEDIQVSIDDK